MSKTSKSKKSNVSKSSVKVKDLRAQKSPRGGSQFDAFLKIDGIKGESFKIQPTVGAYKFRL